MRLKKTGIQVVFKYTVSSTVFSVQYEIHSVIFKLEVYFNQKNPNLFEFQTIQYRIIHFVKVQGILVKIQLFYLLLIHKILSKYKVTSILTGDLFRRHIDADLRFMKSCRYRVGLAFSRGSKLYNSMPASELKLTLNLIQYLIIAKEDF